MNTPLRGVAVVFLTTATILGAAEAWGANLSWQVSSGDWSIATNWNGGVPTADDTGFIANGGSATVTQPGEICGTLSLGGSAGSGTVQMTAGNLYAIWNEYIGDSGSGNFTQSGGANSVSSFGGLYLGNNAGGSGAYSLGGSGQLSVGGWEYVGLSGTGSFTQSGGVNSVSSFGALALGFNAGGSGTYSLVGSGQLSAGGVEYIGFSGTGSFTQSGGVNSVSSFGALAFGLNPGSSGTYNLSGSGLLSAAGWEYVGLDGTGIFTQSGGTHTVGIQLDVGRGAGSGTYNLGGNGLLSVAGWEIIAYTGTGSFIQSGGTNSIVGALDVGPGFSPASIGTYNLSGSGLLSAAGENIGVYGTGSGTFTQSGGTNNVTGSNGGPWIGYSAGSTGTYNLSGSGVLSAAGWEYVGIDGTGTFTQSGGTHTVGDELDIGRGNTGSGTYNLTGSGLLAVAGNEVVAYSETGSFTQSGGTNSVANTMYVGYNAGGSGTYSLSAGSLSTPGSLFAPYSTTLASFYIIFGHSSGTLNAANLSPSTSGNICVGYSGIGSFTQSGGTDSLSNDLVLGFYAGGSGTYNLSGSGLLSAPVEHIGFSGTGSFTQSGGTNSTSHELDLGTNSGSSGSYNLGGNGLLSAALVEVGWSGSGSFTHSGGTNSVSNTLSLADAVGSSGTYVLSGSGLLSAASEAIGWAGTGSFMHSGGTNSVGILVLANYAGSSGTYCLSGSGLLSAAGDEITGGSGNGNFTQSGGINSASGGLALGWYAGGSGTYSLSGNGLLSAPTESIGYSGNGSFVQSGGTHSVSGSFVLGQCNGSRGTYNFNGGLLSLSGLTEGQGNATFNFSGGTFQAGATFSTSVPIALSTAGSNGVFDTNGNTLTLAGALSGPGGLQKVGSGTLILVASNSYTGDTTIWAGAILLNNANAVPNSTVTVSTNNGLLFNTNSGAITTFNVGGIAGSGSIGLADGGHAITLSAGGNGTGTTYSGGLSGAGGLAKVGSGSLTLCGFNTYAGTTSVAAGTLTLDFSQAGAPTANIINNTANASSLALGGGTLAILGNLSTTNGQQFNGLTVNPGCSAIVLTTAGTSNSLLLSLGSISRSAGGTIDFTLPGGTQSAANGTTTTTPNTAAGILGGYATVGGTDWATNTAGNITAYSGYSSGDLGTLGSGGTLNVAPSGPQSSVTSAVSFNTLNLTGTEALTMTGSGSLTLLGGGLLGNTSGTISGGVLAGSASGELIVITPANLTISSAIANNGGATALTKAGSGTLTLTGSNTYSGVTTIGAGTLQVGNGGALGTLGTGTVTDNSALVFNLSGNSTFGGAISGVGSLTQAGAGMLTITGNNTYTGGTTISAGTLELGSTASLPSGTTATVNGTLDLGAFGATTSALTGTGTVNHSGAGSNTLTVGSGDASGAFAGTIESTGGSLALLKIGSGQLTLTGNNTYSGATTVGAGTLQIGNGGATGALGTGTVTDSSALVFNLSGAPTFGGAINGVGSLTQAGTGTQTLGGALTYTGSTTVSQGMLVVTGNSLGSSVLSIASGGTLQVNTATGTGAVGAETSITGGGVYQKTGAGLWDLMGTLTGSKSMSLSQGALIDVEGGELRLGWDGSYCSWTNNKAALNVASGAIFDLWDTNTIYVDALTGAGTVQAGEAGATPTLVVGVTGGSGTFSGVIQNSGGTASLTKIGTGMQTLSGSNTYGGATSVASGTLVFSGSGNGLAGVVNVGTSSGSSGTLLFQGSSVANFTATGDGSFNVAYGSTVLIQPGASVTLAGNLKLGAWTSGSSGNLVQSGGALTINDSSSGRPLTIGEWPGETSTYTLSAGLLSVPNGITYAPWDGAAVLNISGGTANLQQIQVGSNDNQATGGTISLSGSGALYLGSGGIVNGWGPAAIILTGGTIGASASWSSSVAMSLSNSPTIDTKGYGITLSGVLSGSGGLTKIGAGTLILSGSDDYLGGTIVDAGTLCVEDCDALCGGTSLTVGADGTFPFDAPAAAAGETASGETSPGAVVAVPEPGAPALLAMGVLAAVFGVWWRRQRDLSQ